MDSRYIKKIKTGEYNVQVTINNSKYYVNKSQLPIVLSRYVSINSTGEMMIKGYCILGANLKVLNVAGNSIIKLFPYLKNVENMIELQRTPYIDTIDIATMKQVDGIRKLDTSVINGRGRYRGTSERKEHNVLNESLINCGLKFNGTVDRATFYEIEQTFEKFKDKIVTLGYRGTPFKLIIKEKVGDDITFEIEYGMIELEHIVLARLEFMTGGINIVPYIELPEAIYKSWYNINPKCEHCNINHKRNVTYMILNRATGAIKQVGQGCLNAYYGYNILAILTTFKAWIESTKRTVSSDKSSISDEKKMVYWVDDLIAMYLLGKKTLSYYADCFYDEAGVQVQNEVMSIKRWVNSMAETNLDIHNRQVHFNSNYIKYNQIPKLFETIDIYNEYKAFKERVESAIRNFDKDKVFYLDFLNYEMLWRAVKNDKAIYERLNISSSTRKSIQSWEELQEFCSKYPEMQLTSSEERYYNTKLQELSDYYKFLLQVQAVLNGTIKNGFTITSEKAMRGIKNEKQTVIDSIEQTFNVQETITNLCLITGYSDLKETFAVMGTDCKGNYYIMGYRNSYLDSILVRGMHNILSEQIVINIPLELNCSTLYNMFKQPLKDGTVNRYYEVLEEDVRLKGG